MNKKRKRYDSPQKTAIISEAMHNIRDVLEQELIQHEIGALIQKYYYNQDINDVADGLSIRKRSLSRYLCTGLRKVKQHVNEEKTETSILHYIS